MVFIANKMISWPPIDLFHPFSERNVYSPSTIDVCQDQLNYFVGLTYYVTFTELGRLCKPDPLRYV